MPPLIIDAPSDLGLRSTGVSALPDALRAAGLLDRIPGARQGVRVPVPDRRAGRDPATGVLNAPAIGDFSARLADEVGSAIDRGDFPLVLGGDCSILLGPALALRRRGRYGLFFLDGHADYYSPESDPNGEAASMELALVTGSGPAPLADLEGRGPFVREDDVVVFGFRDAESAAEYGSPDVRRSAMHVRDLETVTQAGAAAAAREALARLERSGVEGFWIHLDADVLDDEAMPAVDYRMPGGLRPDELAGVLRVLLASPLAVGMDITIYNPALDDADRSAARVLVDAIGAGFSWP
jgi:arginase